MSVVKGIIKNLKGEERIRHHKCVNEGATPVMATTNQTLKESRD